MARLGATHHRHAEPGEALRVAKVHLLQRHDEGELPYASLVQPLVPERTPKHRFKSATFL